MKRAALFFGLVLVLIIVFILFKKPPISNATPERFWQITAVDTVKYSRDPSRDPNIVTKIPPIVKEAAKLHVTHIAIDTPYDEEFYPILKVWVDAARKNNLKVWFRGNFSGWEGWFGYTQFSSIDEHNRLTQEFIAKHPNLFQDGDIFTPLPEPENGGPGDPRGDDQKIANFNTMLVSSYNNCVSAFQRINKQVSCGFFSTNGDIAKDVLTPETVAKIGNIVVIDHYVNSPDSMQKEIDLLTQKFPDAKIVLGEFGAPIPDINGDMSESQQSDFITKLLQVFYQNRAKILGVNYWTLIGGSTALIRDDYSEKPGFTTVANYYFPSQLQGIVTDTLGDSIDNAMIYDISGQLIGVTENDGTFSLAIKKGQTISFRVKLPGYTSISRTVTATTSYQKLQAIELQPLQTDAFYNVRLFLRTLLPH